MREISVENHLRQRVETLDGRCVKMVPLGWVGIPDRLVILPGGIAVFVELKKPKGGIVSRAQEAWHIWLEERGHWVETLWSRGEVDGFIRRAEERLAHST